MSAFISVLCFLYSVQHFANIALKNCYIDKNVFPHILLSYCRVLTSRATIVRAVSQG